MRDAIKASFLTAILAPAIALGGGPAHAAVTQAIASPTSANIPLGQATSVTLGWRATSTTAGSVTIQSTKGEFRTPAGALLGTASTSLIKGFIGPGSVTLGETVRVPAHVIVRAQQQGLRTLAYRRQFDDGGGALTGEITLQIVTRPAAGFAVSRLALVFDDGKPLRFVARNKNITARATVSFVGSGLFKAVWEVAGPNFIPDDSSYRPLVNVQQYLISTEPVSLVSPSLPTEVAGTYTVRLRVQQPGLGFEAPQLHYFVAAGKQEKQSDDEHDK